MIPIIGASGFLFSLIISGCEQHTRATGATPATSASPADAAQPKNLSILPGSRANNNSPKISGIAEAGSTVSVYANSTCIGTPVATGSASVFQTTGIAVTVADDTFTTFYVKSIGSLTSNCVGSVTYTEDSTAPAAPSSFSITPATGSTSTVKTPILSGTGAENGATIYLYSDAGCSTLLKSTTVYGGAFSFSGFTISGDGLRVFYYKIADSSGNTSACTNTAQSYTLDTSAPSTPASWLMSSPSNGATSTDTTPLISGTGAESAAVVKVYSDSSCSNLLSSATVAAGGSFSIGAFTLAAVAGLKTFYYKIQDTLGNSTSCAATGLSYTLAIAATVTSVSSTSANGTYIAGQTITVTVTFSKTVVVTGTPQLTLETGGTDAVVNYSGPTNTNVTTLTFDYTVANGHSSSDLNYVSTTSLALNGGTIKDTGGNDATLTLPAVTANNSLGGNKTIAVNTAAILSFITGSASPTPPNPDSYGTQSTNTGPHTYTLKNTGNGSTSSTITFSLIGNATAWRITGGTCLDTPDPNPPATSIMTQKTLAQNATCTVEATFMAATQPEGSYPTALGAVASSGGIAIHNMTGTVQCPTTPVVFWSNGTYTAPGGCSDIEVKAWGGGGGSDCCYADGKGGGGGYATAFKHLAPGDSLAIYVGGAGHPAEGSGGNSGGAGGTNGGGAGGGAYAWDGASGGGGYSGFWQTGGLYPCGSYPNYPCLIAGGGGGAASDDVLNHSGGHNGGAGGGTTGTAGSYYYSASYPEFGRAGGGATQSGGGGGGSGGTASTGNNFSVPYAGPCNFDAVGSAGATGGFLTGGNGAAGYSGGYYGGNSSGGGGGGGYYGGGGGGSGASACGGYYWKGTCCGSGCGMGDFPSCCSDYACNGGSSYYGRAGGGGGGGSSYAPSVTGYLKGSTTAAVGTVAGNNTDSDLDGTLWNGSAYAAGNAGNQGLVVIRPSGSAPSGGYP